MSFQSPEVFIEKLNNWFNGLIALPLLAVGYGYLEIFTGSLSGLFKVDIYLSLGVILVFLLYAVFITKKYKSQIKAINKEDGLLLKLEAYFLISKKFYINIFIISMIAAVGLYITGSIAFAGFYAFLLFLLSIYRPNLLTVANKLGLKGDERSGFIKNSKTVIN